MFGRCDAPYPDRIDRWTHGTCILFPDFIPIQSFLQFNLFIFLVGRDYPFGMVLAGAECLGFFPILYLVLFFRVDAGLDDRARRFHSVTVTVLHTQL